MEQVRELLSTELGYVVLLFTLFVVPRMLQRWHIPAALTSLLLGAIAGPGLGLFLHDGTLHLLASFGIVSLFLFAGLEVSADELKRGRRVLWQHLAHRVALLVLGMIAATLVFHIAIRESALVALALFTPSTGFILSTLGRLPLSDEERFWISGKAIATELLALLLLFVVLQSGSLRGLLLASLALAALVAVLPLAFRLFAKAILPHAPNSEFAFVVMLALMSAFVTRQLGAYYLVGAFVVGLAASRFRETLPQVASEQTIHAVDMFASLFVPFYFFNAGTGLRREEFTAAALLLGVVISLVAIPLRLLSVMIHRRMALGEPPSKTIRMAVPMMPTLVFTLVIASILRDRFGLAPEIFGGLIVYTLINTMLPSIYFRVAGDQVPAPWVTAYRQNRLSAVLYAAEILRPATPEPPPGPVPRPTPGAADRP